MLWKNQKKSSNVDDRRNLVAKMGGIAASIFAGIALYGYQFMDDKGPITPAFFNPEEHKEFISVVLASTEDTWKKIFTSQNRIYPNPKLVLFTKSTKSACGQADSSIGPFYCSGDSTIYIDLGFYETLEKVLGAPGDFAQAYVIAHEVGHHVQNVLDTLTKVHIKMSQQPALANELSVKLELQADCYAGIWANSARPLLEPGDINEGINAAARIGDDFLQKKFQGQVMPDTFTHGTSEQRVTWFMKGQKSGKLVDCEIPEFPLAIQ